MIQIHEKEDKYIRIFSDSQAVLKALSKSKLKSKTIQNTRIALNELKTKVIALSVNWMKAHK